MSSSDDSRLRLALTVFLVLLPVVQVCAPLQAQTMDARVAILVSPETAADTSLADELLQSLRSQFERHGWKVEDAESAGRVPVSSSPLYVLEVGLSAADSISIDVVLTVRPEDRGLLQLRLTGARSLGVESKAILLARETIATINTAIADRAARNGPVPNPGNQADSPASPVEQTAETAAIANGEHASRPEDTTVLQPEGEVAVLGTPSSSPGAEERSSGAAAASQRPAEHNTPDEREPVANATSIPLPGFPRLPQYRGSSSPLSSMLQLRGQLSSDLRDARSRSRKITRWSVSLWGVGGALLSAGAYSWHRASESYQDYEDAVYSQEAREYRNLTERWATTTIVLGVSGGAFVLAGSLVQIARPPVRRLEQALEKLDADLARLSPAP